MAVWGSDVAIKIEEPPLELHSKFPQGNRVVSGNGVLDGKRYQLDMDLPRCPFVVVGVGRCLENCQRREEGGEEKEADQSRAS